MSYSPRKRYYKKRKYNIKDIYSPSLYNSNYPSYEQMIGRTYQQSPLYMKNTAETVIDRKKLDEMYKTLLKYKYPIPTPPVPPPPPPPSPPVIPLRTDHRSDFYSFDFQFPVDQVYLLLSDLSTILADGPIFHINPGWDYEVTDFQVHVMLTYISFNNRTQAQLPFSVESFNLNYSGNIDPVTAQLIYSNDLNQASCFILGNQDYNYTTISYTRSLPYDGIVGLVNFTNNSQYQTPQQYYDMWKNNTFGHSYDNTPIGIDVGIGNQYVTRTVGVVVFEQVAIQEVRQ